MKATGSTEDDLGMAYCLVLAVSTKAASSMTSKKALASSETQTDQNIEVTGTRDKCMVLVS